MPALLNCYIFVLHVQFCLIFVLFSKIHVKEMLHSLSSE